MGFEFLIERGVVVSLELLVGWIVEEMKNAQTAING